MAENVHLSFSPPFLPSFFLTQKGRRTARAMPWEAKNKACCGFGNARSPMLNVSRVTITAMHRVRVIYPSQTASDIDYPAGKIDIGDLKPREGIFDQNPNFQKVVLELSSKASTAAAADLRVRLLLLQRRHRVQVFNGSTFYLLGLRSWRYKKVLKGFYPSSSRLFHPRSKVWFSICEDREYKIRGLHLHCRSQYL